MASAELDPNHFTYTSLSEMVVWFYSCTQIYDALGVTSDLYFLVTLYDVCTIIMQEQMENLAEVLILVHYKVSKKVMT
jgi:hypothetical protein